MKTINKTKNCNTRTNDVTLFLNNSNIINKKFHKLCKSDNKKFALFEQCRGAFWSLNKQQKHNNKR